MTDLILAVVIITGALALAGHQIGIAEQDPAVTADDQLLDALAAGTPTDQDLELFVQLLKAWRDEARDGADR